MRREDPHRSLVRSSERAIDRFVVACLRAQSSHKKFTRSLSIDCSVQIYYQTLQATMPRNRSSNKKYKGWKANSNDGKYLAKLLKSGKISPGTPPAAIKERFPIFDKYKPDSFASGLRRMKNKLGVNACPVPGRGTGKWRCGDCCRNPSCLCFLRA